MKLRGSKTVKLLSIFSSRADGKTICSRLILRSLHYLLFISLLMNGSSSLAAAEYKETPLQITASDIADFDVIMRNDPRAVSKEQFELRQRNYWAGQMAHKDRLMQYMLDLKDNKEFAKRFPEESKIVKQYFPELLKLTGEHDRRKFHPDIRAANEIMVKAQGINMRDALAGNDPHLPPHKAKRIGYLMKGSVNDYNSGEAKGVNQVIGEITESLKKRGLPDDEIHRIIDVLNVQVEVKDYYDTGAMRSKEFGKPLQGAYDWIQTLEKKEGAFDLSSERAKKLHEYRKGLAAFSDEWHPIGKNPEKYATAADYLKIQTKDFKTDYIKHFEAKEKRLIAQAVKGTPKITLAKNPLTSKHVTAGRAADAVPVQAGARVSGAISKAGNFAKGAVKVAGKAVAANAAIGAAVSTAEAAVATETSASPVEGVITAVSGGSLGNGETCTSAKCGHFFRSCRIKLQSCDKNCQNEIKKCKENENRTKADECIANVSNKFEDLINKKRTAEEEAKLVKSATTETVAGHSYFEDLCVTPFLRLPLHVQTESRAPDLDAVLNKYAPLIVDFACHKKDGKEMTIDVKLHNHEAPKRGVIQNIVEINKPYVSYVHHYNQRLIIGETGKVDRSERLFDLSKDEPNVTDELHFGNNQAQVLQHCSPRQWAYPGKCRSFEMENIRDLGLFNFRDDRRAVPFYGVHGSLEGRVPLDAVRWARMNAQLVERQVDQIQKCCGDEVCQKYYSKKTEAFHNTAARNRQQIGRGSPANSKVTASGADSSP